MPITPFHAAYQQLGNLDQEHFGFEDLILQMFRHPSFPERVDAAWRWGTGPGEHVGDLGGSIDIVVRRADGDLVAVVCLDAGHEPVKVEDIVGLLPSAQRHPDGEPFAELFLVTSSRLEPQATRVLTGIARPVQVFDSPTLDSLPMDWASLLPPEEDEESEVLLPMPSPESRLGQARAEIEDALKRISATIQILEGELDRGQFEDDSAGGYDLRVLREVAAPTLRELAARMATLDSPELGFLERVLRRLAALVQHPAAIDALVAAAEKLAGAARNLQDSPA